jgi:hypothetical protein
MKWLVNINESCQCKKARQIAWLSLETKGVRNGLIPNPFLIIEYLHEDRILLTSVSSPLPALSMSSWLLFNIQGSENKHRLHGQFFKCSLGLASAKGILNIGEFD